MPQLTSAELIKFTKQMTTIGSKCCQLSQDKLLPCAEENVSLLVFCFLTCLSPNFFFLKLCVNSCYKQSPRAWRTSKWAKCSLSCWAALKMYFQIHTCSKHNTALKSMLELLCEYALQAIHLAERMQEKHSVEKIPFILQPKLNLNSHLLFITLLKAASLSGIF